MAHQLGAFHPVKTGLGARRNGELAGTRRAPLRSPSNFVRASVWVPCTRRAAFRCRSTSCSATTLGVQCTTMFLPFGAHALARVSLVKEAHTTYMCKRSEIGRAHV